MILSPKASTKRLTTIHTNSKPNQHHLTWESHDGLERPINSSNPRRTWETHNPCWTWCTHKLWRSHDLQRRREEQLGLVRWLEVAYDGGLRWGLWQWVRPWWFGDGIHVHHGFGSEDERANKREEDKRGKWNNEKGRERRINQIIK